MNGTPEMMEVDSRKDQSALSMKVTIDGESLQGMGAFRILVPCTPSVEAEGWVDCYAVDEKTGYFVAEGGEILMGPRRKGLTRWEPL